MRLKNIIWKTVVMSLMASPLCISCDDDDEVTVNSKFYLSTKVFPVDSYEASLSVILKDNSVVVNELQPNYRFVACATERLSKDVKITADSDDNLVSVYNKANDTRNITYYLLKIILSPIKLSLLKMEKVYLEIL
jgi:hypothetical protein